MSIMELGALGEFLGSIGVIATLIYLAIQIRQNTRSVRDSAYQAMYRSSIEMSALVAHDVNAASAFRRGLQGHDQLTDDELVQFHAIMQGMFSGFQMFFGMWRRSLIDDLEWEPVAGNVEFYLGFPGGVEWWSTRMSLDTRFTTFVEEEILK